MHWAEGKNHIHSSMKSSLPQQPVGGWGCESLEKKCEGKEASVDQADFDFDFFCRNEMSFLESHSHPPTSSLLVLSVGDLGVLTCSSVSPVEAA